MLDRLIKISSLASAFLIFCGVLKLTMYYSTFNIRIVEFLSFGEIITSFLDDINVLLAFCLAMFIQTVPVMNYAHRKTNSDNTVPEFFDQILSKAFPIRKRFFFGFMVALSVSFVLIKLEWVQWNYGIIYFMLFCIIQGFTFLLLKKFKDGKIELSNVGGGQILIIALVSSLFLFTQYDIQEVSSGKYDVNIRAQECTITCSKATGNVYIGKTDGYLFVLLANHSTQVIPISEVKQLIFSAN